MSPPPRKLLALLLLCLLCLTALESRAQRQMETLGRGLVVVRSSATQAYVGWRLLGTDPPDVAFNVYRSVNGGAATKLNAAPLTATTDYVDAPDFAQSNAYTVRPVVGGVEKTPSPAFTLPANVATQQYLNVPLQIPPGGTTPDGVAYTYSANDCSVGDLDGDGEYEIIVKWDPSNAKDNSQGGYTGNVFIDGYKLNGTRLWRIDLGRNIRAGAHYTDPMVYDLDGDGIAEIACKTAPGTLDGAGTPVLLNADEVDDDYRNGSGYVLDGPEYLTIFNGRTGVAMATTGYVPVRGTVANWGDAYGNRVDRFLAGIAYLDGVRPSLIMCRGYYTRAAITAWDWRNGTLTQRWAFDTGDSTTGPLAGYRGQGAHSLTIGDVDGDGKDEITYGACAINDDGTGLYTTGLGHGDALHMGDFDPDRPGLEVWMVHESPSSYGPNGLEFRDARTGALIFGVDGQNADVGRGVASNIDPRYPGAEMWGARGSLMSASGVAISSSKPSMNFAVWWDADLQRELLDNVSIRKWDYVNSVETPLLAPSGVSSNNSTKATPNLSGDILGDWREEVVWRTTDSSALRIYTTTIPAANRFVTLMHDPQYREAIAWQLTGYNQPPHPSFYIGDDMSTPPRAPIWAGDLVWNGASSATWENGGTANWLTGVVNASASPFVNGKSVLFSIGGTATAPVSLTGTLTPSAVVVHNPVGKNYVFGGSGSLAGTMTLTKAGQGSLTLNNSHPFTGATDIQEGTLIVNGGLPSSAVSVQGAGCISGGGTLGQSLNVKRRGRVSPGAGIGSAATLTVGPTTIDNANLELDLSNTPAGAKDLLAVQGDLVLTGTTQVKINLLGGLLSGGSYPLITWTGNLTGSLANLPVSGLSGTPGDLAIVGKSIVLVVGATRAAAATTWRGSGGDWDLLLTKNWVLGGQPDFFVSGDSVTFNDAGAARPAVNLTGELYPGSVTFNNSAANYTLSGTGSIAGPGGLTKSGTSTLTISNVNSYTGVTTLNGGRVEVTTLTNGGAASALGAATSASGNLVFNGGLLAFTGASATTDRGATLTGSGNLEVTTGALTIDGVLTGSGGLTKSGDGSLKLTNANTHSGGTTIVGGTVTLASSSALGSGAVILGDGTTLNVVSYAPVNALIVASGTTQITGGSSGGTMGIGAISGASDAILNAVATSVFDFRGAMTGFSGTVNLGVAGGGFRLNGSAVTGSPTATFNLSGASLNKRTTSNATISFGALNGDAASSLTGATGSGNASTTGFVIGGNNVDCAFLGTIGNGGGTVSLTKSGTGRLALGGACTHTGATTVSAGALYLTGGSTITASPVTVANGASFGGSGSVTPPVTVQAGGKLGVPATAAGTLTLGGGLTMTGGGTLVCNLALGNTVGGGVNDLFQLSGGTLALGGTITIQPNYLNGALRTGTYTLITGGTATTGAPTFVWGGNGGESVTFDTATAGTLKINVVSSIRGPVTVTWTGAMNSAWDSATFNWKFGGNADRFLPDDSVLFDDTLVTATANIVSSVQPVATTVAINAKNLTISGANGGITGAGTLTKTGTGTLTLTGANAYAGKTFINGGTVATANDTATQYGLGSGSAVLNNGTVSFGGGTLQLYDDGATYNRADFNIEVPAGASGTLRSDSRIDYYGSLTGGGTLNFYIPFIREFLYGNWAAFTGQINVTSDADGGELRIANTNGYATAKVDLGPKVGLMSASLTTSAVAIGELSGDATAQLRGLNPISGNPSGSPSMTWTVGNLGTNATFGGTITNGLGTARTGVTKVGAGTWTLAGSSTYTRATTINAGVLEAGILANGGVASSIGAASNSGTNLVLNGATFRYAGRAATTDRRFTLGSAGGTLDASGSGAVVFSNVNAVTLSNPSTTSRTLTLTGTNGGDNTLTLPLANATGGGVTSLRKTGPGTWVLPGPRTYTGATTVSGGLLRVPGTLSNGSAVTVENTGTLDLAGTGSVGAVTVQSGGTLTGGGTVNGNLTNSGTVILASGTLTVTGNMISNAGGIVRLRAGATLAVNGTFTNNGVIDLINGGTLPANLVNNGIILDSSSVQVKQIAGNGTTISVIIQSYPGHDYQLLGTTSLTAPDWQPIGLVKAGTGGVLTLSDDNPSGPSRFYRIAVTP